MRVLEKFMSKDYEKGFEIGQTLYSGDAFNDKIIEWTVLGVNPTSEYTWYEVKRVDDHAEYILVSIEKSSGYYFTNLDELKEAIAFSKIWADGKDSLKCHIHLSNILKEDTLMYLESFMNKYPELIIAGI